MKKIILIYLNREVKNEFLNNKLNSLIKYEFKTKKFYYHYKNNIEEVQFLEFLLKREHFNRWFVKLLEEYIQNSLEEVNHISEEEIVHNYKNLKNIQSAIASLVTNYCYEDLTKKDIFNFFTDIFIRFLTAHYLINGNKRFAFIYLYTVLYSFGYCFNFWTKKVTIVIQKKFWISPIKTLFFWMRLGL